MDFSFQSFGLAFIPIFVAIDIVGVIPMFISLTSNLEHKPKKKLIRDATMTALALALIFMATGKLIFNFLGITENDFRIGGGIILLVLAITDLFFTTESQRDPGKSIGIVPIGIPLIMGPAALTSIIIVVDQFGFVLTFLSIFANLIIVYIAFRQSDLIMRIMGHGGSRAFAKVASLFMVAIAVMMIRVGIQNILK